MFMTPHHYCCRALPRPDGRSKPMSDSDYKPFPLWLLHITLEFAPPRHQALHVHRRAFILRLPFVLTFDSQAGDAIEVVTVILSLPVIVRSSFS